MQKVGREKAIKYSLANEAESEGIIPEMRALHGNSWQALSYKNWTVKIMEPVKKPN
jgi:hypothetical protein